MKAFQSRSALEASSVVDVPRPFIRNDIAMHEITINDINAITRMNESPSLLPNEAGKNGILSPKYAQL